jgi:hypothetical protein
MYIVETNVEKRILSEDCVTNVEFKKDTYGRDTRETLGDMKRDNGRQKGDTREIMGDNGRHYEIMGDTREIFCSLSTYH